jgi:hypothetical protein
MATFVSPTGSPQLTCSVHRPRPGDTELARLLGHIGKLGSNVNQIAKIANTYRRPTGKSALSVMRRDIAPMRNGVLKTLRRGH